MHSHQTFLKNLASFPRRRASRRGHFDQLRIKILGHSSRSWLVGVRWDPQAGSLAAPTRRHTCQFISNMTCFFPPRCCERICGLCQPTLAVGPILMGTCYLGDQLRGNLLAAIPVTNHLISISVYMQRGTLHEGWASSGPK